MPTNTLNDVLRHLRQLCEAEPARDLADADLLERFLARSEETAFAILVQRHGPMVLGVCRRVLHDRPAVEDAFQATFLVLVRKAASIRKSGSLASWLYGVAQRVARHARAREAAQRARERRSAEMPRAESFDELTWQELRTILDDEIGSLPERYRAPVVLCYLEGKSYDQAARDLGCPKSSLASRLGRARRALRDRLARRGVALTAAGLAAGLTERASAAVPALLAIHTVNGAVHFAAGKAAAGIFSSQAIALAEESMKGMLGFKGKVLAVLLAVGFVAAGVGLAASQTPVQPPPAAKPAPAQVQPPAEAPTEVHRVRGQVLLPDGKPAANVTIIRRRANEVSMAIEDTTAATTGRDGRFEVGHEDRSLLIASAPGYAPDWTTWEFKGGDLTLRLTERATIRGRLLDLEGKPVVGARVKVMVIKAPVNGNLQAAVDAFRVNPEWTWTALPKQLGGGIPGSSNEAKTGADGRFELDGFGKDRVVELRFEGDSIESVKVHVILSAGFDPKSVLPTQSERFVSSMTNGYRPTVYGPEFTHAVRPSHLITGVVTDAINGKPLPGVKVMGTVGSIGPFNNSAWDDAVEAVTDGDGRYRLSGLPKAKLRHLHVQPHDTPYLDRLVEVADVPAYTPATADVKLQRAVMVEGRLVDGATGKPTWGRAFYLPLECDATLRFLESNPAYSHENSISPRGLLVQSDADGRFKLRVPACPGVILGRADTQRDPSARYTATRVADADRKFLRKPPKDNTEVREVGPRSNDEYFDTHMLISPVRWENGYALVHPKATDETMPVTIRFSPGRTLTGTVVGPEGRPLAGARASGVLATGENGPTTFATSAFRVYALEPDRPRTVYFWHPGKNLVGTATLRGDETEAPVVKMQPASVVVGRVLDRAGKPVAGMEIQFQLGDGLPDELIRQKLHGRSSQSVVTDADGRFRLEGMFPGLELSIYAARPGYRTLAISFGPLTLKPGEVRDLGEKRIEEPTG